MELENAALPHGSGTDRKLGPQDFALFDCTGSRHGYWSDITRVWFTFFVSFPPQEVESYHWTRQLLYRRPKFLMRTKRYGMQST